MLLSYRLEIRQKYHRINNMNISISYSDIMLKIGSLFNGNLLSRERELKLKNEYKKYYSYIISINSINNLLLVKNYFDRYPLLSSKRLDYEDWSLMLNNIIKNNNSSSHPECYNLGLNIRKNYNSTRTKYNWDHLNKNLIYF